MSGGRERWSVRTRTAGAMLLILLPVLLFGSAVAVWFQRIELTRSEQALAAAQAQALVDEIARDGIPTRVSASEMAVPGVGEGPLFQILSNGSVALQSRALAARHVSEPVITAPTGRHESRTLHGIVPGEADRYLAVGLDVPASGDHPAALVVVMRDLETVDAATSSSVRILAVGLPLLMVAVGLAGWTLTGRALAPVDRLRRTAAEISGAASPTRLPVPGTDEIGRLAETLNAMLDRIGAAEQSQRRFVADASHELRSPIATIRTLMEVSELAPTDSDELRTAVLGETTRLQRVVDGLLLLARRDADPHATTTFEPVDLVAVVDEEVARRRQGMVEWTPPQAPVTVAGPGDALRVIVDNVVMNALRHARSRVAVSLTSDGEWATVVVDDDGPGIPDDQHERIFDRFTRLDEARGRDAGGAGLGLAISRELALERGGTLRSLPGGAGARFELRLPLLSA